MELKDGFEWKFEVCVTIDNQMRGQGEEGDVKCDTTKAEQETWLLDLILIYCVAGGIQLMSLSLVNGNMMKERESNVTGFVWKNVLMECME